MYPEKVLGTFLLLVVVRAVVAAHTKGNGRVHVVLVVRVFFADGTCQTGGSFVIGAGIILMNDFPPTAAEGSEK